VWGICRASIWGCWCPGGSGDRRVRAGDRGRVGEVVVGRLGTTLTGGSHLSAGWKKEKRKKRGGRRCAGEAGLLLGWPS
jgi:hypothetical protein